MLSKEEVKLQCLHFACYAFSNRGGSVAYTEDDKSSKQSTANVLETAKLLYEWVSKEDA